MCEVYVYSVCIPIWEIRKPREAKEVCWLHCSRTFPFILLKNDFSLPRSRLVVSKPPQMLLSPTSWHWGYLLSKRVLWIWIQVCMLGQKALLGTKPLFWTLNSLLNSKRNNFIGEIQCWYCCFLRKQSTKTNWRSNTHILHSKSDWLHGTLSTSVW